MSCDGFLTNVGFIIPVCVLKAKLKNKWQLFLNKLTITTPQKVGPAKRATMYSFETYNGVNCIRLPRTLIKTLSGLIAVDILLPSERLIAASIQIELYENQQILIDWLMENVFARARILAGTAAAILNLRAGMGKTFVAAGIINRLKMRTLYIVPKRPLMMQAVKDLRAAFHNPDAPAPARTIIGAYGKTKQKDSTTNVELQDITCIVINSALERPPEFFAGYSLIILDEVHSYCSEQRKAIFRNCSRAALGMTATSEDRGDGFDAISHKELAFDGIIRADEIPGFTYGEVLFDCEAKIINYSGPAEHTQNLTHDSTGRIFTHYMHNQFIGDPYRLKLAVGELIRLYDSDNTHHIYVFAEEINILQQAKTAFAAALASRAREDIVGDIACPEGGAEMFTGGLNDQKILDITRNARVLFSTYSYAGTGISIQKMTAIMFLTPRKANMKQILARILRRGSDVNIPRIVVDIVDKKTALRYQVATRKLAYDYYGFKITETGIKFTDVL